MITAVRPGTWRPYEDAPLFVPELILGLPALEPDHAGQLTRFLAALVARRGVVHVAVAFNAIYFGYDLSFGGYVGGPVDFDAFPPVRFGETTDALPVGAMVNVATGTDPLYAEVVYKEGAHPALGDDGDVPPWLSGAPAGAAGPDLPPGPHEQPVLSERLVVDIDAFGTETVTTRGRFDRLRQRGRWLDADGHLLLDARYPSAADAEASDREFYARYLLSTGRDQLLAGPLPLVLSDAAGEEELATAVRAALDTIAAALAAVPALRMWRDYAFTRAGFGQRLTDRGPLGGPDLSSLAVAVSRAGASQPRRRYATPAPHMRYTAVGPLLRTVSGAARHLAGLGYPLAVCHANAVIGDYARRDADDTGILPSGAHLRLDDPWQGGGVWRASIPPGPHATIDPLVPYGLGWLDTRPPPPPELDSADAARDLDSGADVLSVTDSHVSWTVTLRLAHQLAGVAPLPERVTHELSVAGLIGTTLRLVLAHDGYELDPADATQAVTVAAADGVTRLTGVAWPLEFFAGIVLTFTWQRGALVLRARSALLETSVSIDGVDYEHRYDPAVLTRDTAPGYPRRGASDQGPVSLHDRVLGAVRRLGKLDMDGVAVLPRDRLADLVYGPDAGSGADAALAPVVTGLIIAGEITVEQAIRVGAALRWPPADAVGEAVEVLVWRPKPVVLAPRPRGPHQDPARSPAENLTHFVREYTVTPFLRRLPEGQHASDEQRAEYRRLLSRFGRAGELPDGYTLVREHVRSRA